MTKFTRVKSALVAKQGSRIVADAAHRVGVKMTRPPAVISGDNSIQRIVNGRSG